MSHSHATAPEHGTSHGSDVPAGRGSEEFWEGFYRSRGQVWSGRPNAVLVDVVGRLEPGTALDLGCGEGGDAVWLAERGWRVTAVDVAAAALERVQAHAAQSGVEVVTEQHDLAHTFPAGSFDLVSACYLASPIEFPREQVLRRATKAVAPGGLLLVVDHGSVPPWGWAHPDTQFPSPQELLASLDLPEDKWRPERVEARQREATGPEGQTGRLTDTVVAVQRAA
jgi:SAM-dependent methyltransferase